MRKESVLPPLDEQATQLACELFPGRSPKVYCYGPGQYAVRDGPFGYTVCIYVSERKGFLIAAAQPRGQVMPLERLDPTLHQMVARQDLRPWAFTGPVAGLPGALQWLAEAERSPPGPVPQHGDAPTPFLLPLPRPTGSVLGTERTRKANLVSSMMRTQAANPLLALLQGPEGVGKHHLASVAAKGLGWPAWELPLGRLAVERVIQSRVEAILDHLVVVAREMPSPSLLVVSDAELLDGFRLADLHLILDELRRHRKVILMARTCALLHFDQTIPVWLPGWARPEADEYVQKLCPGVLFEGRALDLLLKAAALPPHGVIPGRLVYMVALAKELLGEVSGTALTPDEVVGVLRLVEKAWAREQEE